MHIGAPNATARTAEPSTAEPVTLLSLAVLRSLMCNFDAADANSAWWDSILARESRNEVQHSPAVQPSSTVQQQYCS